MSTGTVVAPLAQTRNANATLDRGLTYASILVADLGAFLIAGALSVMVRYLFHGQFTPAEYLSFLPSILILFTVFAVAGLYPGLAINPIDEFRSILRSSSLVFLLIIGTTFFLREQLFASRIIFVLAWLCTVVLVPVSRRLMRGWCSRQSWWGIPTVILGEREAGEMMLGMLAEHPRLGLRPIAILYDSEPGHRPAHDSTSRIFAGDLEHSAMFAREHCNCYAIIAMPLTGSAGIKTIFTEHADHYRRVLIIPDLFGMSSLAVKAKDIGGILGLEINHHLARVFPQLLKRCFDLAICLVIGVLISPVLLLLYLAVRLTSRGPAFYGQRRIGKGDKEFKVWKFRSMVTNADQVLQQHLERDPALRAEWKRDHKLRVDPRVTAIGRLLRKTSLDELPQLWNVVCGEMSLVGPRPIVQSEVEKYGKIFRQYLRVTPGITGLWQISGRNNTTYATRIQLDEYYVRNWSASLDLYILFRTLRTVVLGEGAY